MSPSRGVQLRVALRELLEGLDTLDVFTYGLLASRASPGFWAQVLVEWQGEEGRANLVAKRQAQIDQLVARFEAVWETL